MHDASLVVKAEKGKKTRHLVLHRIKARSREGTWNAGIAVRKAIFVTNARNPRKPTPRRANPKKEQNKSDGQANAAKSDSEGEGAWALDDDDNDSVASEDSLPDMHQVSDSDNDDDDEAHTGFEDWESEESDWFSDVPDGDEGDAVAEQDTDTVKDLEDASGETLVTTDSLKSTHHMDLYNSGCTNHISPFHDQFENYADIPLKRF